jgi:hypothetical protein
MLPAGKPGRDGVGSAQITPRHCATVLLGPASLAWCDPIEPPDEARRLAEFRRFPRRDVPLLDILPGEIISAGHSMAPASWRFSRRTVVRERGGDTPVRFVAADAPAMDGVAIRETVLDGALIAAVGRLFAVVAAEAACTNAA